MYQHHVVLYDKTSGENIVHQLTQGEELSGPLCSDKVHTMGMLLCLEKISHMLKRSYSIQLSSGVCELTMSSVSILYV